MKVADLTGWNKCAKMANGSDVFFPESPVAGNHDVTGV